MNKLNELPKNEKKKKIDIKKLEELSKKVRKYLEEEAQYLQNKNMTYGTNKASKFV